MSIKAVIFDLDGVIVTTDQYHYRAWKKIADQENIYFDEEINNQLRGVSRMDSLEIILKRAGRTYSDAEKQKMAEEKNTVYKELLNSLTGGDILPKVAETLAELKRRGIPAAIGSSSKNAVFILNKIGLYEAFDAVSDGNNISKSKPDPEVFIKAAEMLGIPNSECLVVEDASAGIEAAKAAGMAAAAIGDARSNQAADYRIERIDEILAFPGLAS
ncbi:beta-phosphoglucomutase [Breznakiella homolactica]|uniref:Beta-phosphoglucomutase n=1 Tax=Breznakiella homolactica TaxID=2798577 RepID=A0A7T8B8U3_9SPIR|nr:beta-phosphoglucomutase [Breznakiella homolactica]QQO07742.1 beta-phosphoglucomutase [Breznakiella homolactica]